MSKNSSVNPPKSGFERILDFLNFDLKINHPVALKEVVDKTGISYTYIKRTLNKLKEENYCGFHFEQSGAIWIAWKDREKIIKKLENTCSRFLKND